MHTVTTIDKNSDIWVSDDNGDPVPGIEFSLYSTNKYIVETVSIYYNTIDQTWFGWIFIGEDWEDLSENDLNHYIDAFNLKARIHDDR